MGVCGALPRGVPGAVPYALTGALPNAGKLRSGFFSEIAAMSLSRYEQ